MALRHAAARFAAFGAVSSTTATRAFGTSAMRATEAQKESIASFMSAFEAVKPSTMENPSTPSAFMKPLPEVPATPPAKLTLNFYVPHNIEFDGAEVDQVQVPATSGDMGVLPGHVPTVVQMRPGVVAVTLNDKEVQKVRARVITKRSLDGAEDEIERRARRARDRAAGNPTAKSTRGIALVPVSRARFPGIGTKSARGFFFVAASAHAAVPLPPFFSRDVRSTS